MPALITTFIQKFLYILRANIFPTIFFNWDMQGFMASIEDNKIYEHIKKAPLYSLPNAALLYLRRFFKPHGFDVADFFAQHTLNANFQRNIRSRATRTSAAQMHEHNAVFYTAHRYFTAVALNKRTYFFVHYHGNALMKSFIG